MELLSKQRKAKLEACISLEHLIHNFRTVRTLCSSRICCVIKADAYGHGAWQCAKTLADAGADFFAVSSIAEAEEVRLALEGREGIDILILGYTMPADADLLLRYDISQAVYSPEYADALCRAIREYKLDGVLPADAVLKIHVKIDTGMNRIGYAPDDIPSILALSGIRDFAPVGIFTHFAQSDTPASPMTSMQFSTFERTVAALAAHGMQFPLRHVCNSAAVTNFPEMHLDMVRWGIELYGLRPSGDTVLPDLKPVMTLKTVVSHIHTVPAGASVGYGAAFKPDRDIQLATLPIGYADGFIRAYGDGGFAVIRGKHAPICGRICMDQCMVDVTDIPGVRTGDEVVLFGEGAPSADDIAARAGTIGYEVLCLIGKRVPRVYTK
ncbi:MAG: alanine racemase [Clostridia bacterium]|nr:alanine racemase [Clostridia bacterium]